MNDEPPRERGTLTLCVQLCGETLHDLREVLEPGGALAQVTLEPADRRPFRTWAIPARRTGGRAGGRPRVSGPATHASGPRRETKRINAADQAAARAVVVERADLRPQGGWKGGATKPEYLLLNCPYYHPDLSRFVITGEAASRWSRMSSKLGVLTETSVSQTAQMLRREWEIGLRPEAIRCVRSTYARQAAATGAVLVSFKRVSFPHVATRSTAFELRASVGRERLMVDLVFIGQGRTGITLAVSGTQSARRIISAEAIRLARILVGRIQV